MRDLLSHMTPREQPLELQILGRTLFHAALVGLGAGILGCAFFAGAELLQNLLLEQLAGYEPLRAHGEKVWGPASDPQLRLWLILFIPAFGALIAGLLIRLAPECRGGGGDAAIAAFHHDNGVIRRRVIWIKPLASIATLGSGGSGGREGPTMLIGGALGSTVGRYLNVSPRERRVLMVAGIAAGISAVFRTPLGAALLAIEMLYRDDFEAEALIPAVLASVIAYSVAISVFGHSTLFGHLPPFAFRPGQIPLYIVLAVVISAAAALFVAALHGAQRIGKRIRVAEWARPALGGLALGVFVLAFVHLAGAALGRPDQGLGVLGGGYGAAQVAISGADWLPTGWGGVEILLLLALAKIIATSFTIGSGGSAGDFAPALAVGGLLGGAFGLAAQLALGDPSIQPGAFALVGMGTFYGAIANTPLAALVIVCEMAGSYDLLVPLMLAEGVAFVALRRVSLYPAQVPTLRDSPAHQSDYIARPELRCRDAAITPVVPVHADVLGAEIEVRGALATKPMVLPVVDSTGALSGLVVVGGRTASPASSMIPPRSVTLDQDLRSAAAAIFASGFDALPVVDDRGAIVGMLDEHAIAVALVEDVAPNQADLSGG